MSSKNKPVPTKGLYIAAVTGTPGPSMVSASSGGQRDGVILPSLARAVAVYTTDPYFSPDIRGLRLYINVTVNNGGTLVVKIQSFDQSSQTWADFPLATTGNITTDVMGTLTVYPGQTETAGVDVSNAFTDMWRVVATVTTATMTFSIGGEYLG